MLWRRPPTMWLPLVLFVSAWCAHAMEDHGPRISSTKFETVPTTLQYFDDSDIILVQERQKGKVWKSNDAGKEWKVIGEFESDIDQMVMHPHDKKSAFALSRGSRHWYTNDQGDSWQTFNIESVMASDRRTPMSFHAGDSSKIIFNGLTCGEMACEEVAYYTTDGFKHHQELRRGVKGCHFARSTDLFHTSADDEKDQRVLCTVEGKFSTREVDYRLLVSDDYFETEHEPLLEEGRPVQGVINMAVVKSYLVVVARAKGTTELAMYVTDDAQTWHRAIFPSSHKLEQDAYTILESTNYSLQVDVMTTRTQSAMGVLFGSNSNGTYFTELVRHTNRNIFGIVDFEKVQDIQGIITVNVVDNWEEVEKASFEDKHVKSKISFDDGRTFKSLRAGEEELHLHSVTAMANVGRVLSSSAPGLVMGVGNTGAFLNGYRDGDLFVSQDAGLTWSHALKEAHKYEFGNEGCILVAVYDEDPTDIISYSTDYGTTWEEAKLDREMHVRLLTTTPDSTSLKFVMIGTEGRGNEVEYFAYSLDFAGLKKRYCVDDDFEKWYARLDDHDDPACLMGHKQYYMRRKPDADCFIKTKFEDPEPKYEVCACSDQDFECDFNFIRDEEGKQCVPATKIFVPAGACHNAQDKFLGPSGYRLIPGNACSRENGGSDLDKEKEWPCDEANAAPANGDITTTLTSFKAHSFKEYHYLERAHTSHGDDETVVLRLDNNEVWMTKDHGKTWKRILKDVPVLAIVPSTYHNDAVYFLTADRKVWYSINRGDTFGSFEAPEPPNIQGNPVLQFHPNRQDWLIWTGAVDCEHGTGGNCHSVASLSEDRGDHWTTLVRYAKKCEFIKEDGRGDMEKLIYCEQHQAEKPDGMVGLVVSDNFFANRETKFENILDFATMSEFIIVAARDKVHNLMVDVSIDGQTFAPADFPPDSPDRQDAYTLLDSSTHSVFLHVTVSSRTDFEYGKIMKSNSNGTSYVLSAPRVNRNSKGYVDFEKMQGLDGVALTNIVANVDEEMSGRPKQLKTVITHNDGSQWGYIKAPATDADGNPAPCDISDIEACALQLHGYTERADPRDSYSSATAIGLMLALGNVGPHLTRRDDADLFLTNDGGLSWRAVMKGNFMWEYGDQGSVIVIVQERVSTNLLYYTLNEGQDWKSYEFARDKMYIIDITTVPSDNSRNFLLWGRKAEDRGEVIAMNVDFAGIKSRKCVLNEEDPNDEQSDYYLWEPMHPSQKDNCLFGHVAQYHRKKPAADCWNDYEIHRLYNIARNCTCQRHDFECDYNYAMANDGSCQLVAGLQPQDHSLQCQEHPDQVSYWKPTGYRRIPLTTCQGGQEFDYTSQEIICPGHEEQYEEAHRGLSGFAFFLVVIVLPIAAASGIGYYIYRRWDGKIGSIRLGDSGSAFDAGQPWIRYPVALVSGVIAVLAAIPLLTASLWRSATGIFGGGRTYTTRQSFARGRSDYAIVDPDEDELLGEDEDEDV